MAHSVEPRCPFLDREIRSLSDALPYHEHFDGVANKVTLRRSFTGVLPSEILHRRKTSCDVGSGLRGLVVRYLRRNGRSEREELRMIWKQIFTYEPSQPYFHAYPVLDAAIDKRGESPR
jgi:asparagine synthase (glutamine-hydrolysing)